MGPRATVDAALDWVRFRLDTFPSLDYQPIPAAGIDRAKRDVGVHSRWDEMVAAVDRLEDRPLTALDIGSNVGFFSFGLAERGYSVLALEQEDKFFRPLRRMAGRFEGAGVVVPANTTLDNQTVALLPDVSVTLFLSVWHHLVRWSGMASARETLSAVWAHTEGLMLFESGEHELDAEWGLGIPEDMEGAAWVEALIADTCPGARIERLGEHDAFSPSDEVCERTLFGVWRD